jgi:hypothetical protein
MNMMRIIKIFRETKEEIQCLIKKKIVYDEDFNENDSSEIIRKFIKKINKVPKDEDVRYIKIIKRKTRQIFKKVVENDEKCIERFKNAY